MAVWKQAWERGLRVRPLVLAPDPEYSQAGRTRLLYFHRPPGPFARYERAEFLLPRDRIVPLVEALLDRPEDLPRFAPFREASNGVRHLMVCTHGTVDACCATLGYPLYRALREHDAARSGHPLRVWRVCHFGGHRFAPTLLDLPEGRYWGHLDPASLDALVRRDGPTPDLRRVYRGWSGLNSFAQVVEREAFAREGWAWADYLKAACTRDEDGQPLTLEADSAFGDDPPRRVEVRIQFAAPDRSTSGAYQATLELGGRTPAREGCRRGHAWERHSYRITRLDRRVEPFDLEDRRTTTTRSRPA